MRPKAGARSVGTIFILGRRCGAFLATRPAVLCREVRIREDMAELCREVRIREDNIHFERYFQRDRTTTDADDKYRGRCAEQGGGTCVARSSVNFYCG